LVVIMDNGVRLLGTPVARAGGASLPLGPSKPHAALVYVAASGGFVRRAELAELLWPGLDDGHAHASLRQALRRLSAGPLGDLLGRDRAGVWLDGECDVAGFRRAVAERRWVDALTAHQGTLLEGFEIDDADEFGAWLASARVAVAEDWRRACRALMMECKTDGRYGDAVGYADLLVRADPLDEQAVREAMQAAVADGDPRGAARRFQDLASLLRDECGVEPEAATQALFGRLAAPTAHEWAVPGSHRIAAVRPRAVGEWRGLIGRDATMADLVERLRERESRLITLLGPGGIGKSALASALAVELATAFPDGVVFVPLEGADGPDAVALALAHALAVRVERRGSIAAHIVRALEARHMLVVLDGFEKFAEQVPFLDALLRGTRELRVLVTSRERLHHSAEVVFEVDPLATGGSGSAASAAGPPVVSPAAQLFLRAAAGRLPLATVRRFGLERVERVVEALGGHPLAIELAASWVDVLGLDLLSDQLQTSWTPLSSDDVDRSERQRDVRAVIEETWQNLASADRVAWMRLAVMPGSLDSAVAAEVGGGGWQALRRLLDRAILRHRGARLEFHALLARFGREQAEAAGQVDEAWRAARVVWRARIARQVDPRSGRMVNVHPDDLDQAVGVWLWACAAQDWETVAEMAVGLMRALDRQMRWRQAMELRQDAVDRLIVARTGPARDVALARLWPLLGPTPWAQKANAARALTLAEARRDDLAMGLAHARLARGNFTAEREVHIREARAAFERAGDEIEIAMLLGVQGDLSVMAGRLDQAQAFLAEALQRSERLGDVEGMARALLFMADHDGFVGDLAAARDHLRQARELLVRSGGQDHAAWTPMLLAVETAVARVAGDRDEATRAFEAFTLTTAQESEAPYLELVLRLAHHARFGPPAEALEAAERLLRHPETMGGRTIYRMLAHLQVAMSRARLGEPELGLDHLRDAVRLARPWDVPRLVAWIAVTAATVALARGETAFAVRMADAALRHPALEFEARANAEVVRSALGLEACETAPEHADVPAAAMPVDVLGEVETWLAPPG
jgi:DNA-binding SARP family transcriptional activator/tetratricopeptide (TPR) repeat protein